MNTSYIMICNLKLSLLLYGVLIVTCQDTIVTRTRLGDIKGTKQVLSGNINLFQFLKIPFAKAPVGNLRFENPQPVEPWNGILDATKHGPSCIQMLGRYEDILPNKNVSEDCLFLNIYVPNEVSSNNSKAVMIWIHGGSYTTGQAAGYDGSFIALTGDVIVVVIQYRLGVFGFFSKDALKGNYGLWDQIMAIQWVKDNIASFGGDAESITIFGESAGGFSVGLLSMIPQNRGLFQRAILQSGTAISSYTILKLNPSSEHVATFLNCTLRDAQISISCLKDMPADDLLTASLRFMSPSNLFHSSFAPVIDGDLLKDKPSKLLANRASAEYKFFRSLDIVIGTVSGEASLFISEFGSKPDLSFNISDGIPKRVFCDVIAPDMAAVAYNNDRRISDAICKFYANNTDYIAQTYNILNAYSDFAFHVPAVESLNIHSEDNNNRGTQYHYLFSRPSPVSVSGPYPSWFNRAEHASDIVFQFTNYYWSDNDNIQLATTFMTYWTHFAKSGNMNVTGLPLWKEYDTVNYHYINFDVPITTGQRLFEKRANFWLTDIPAILNSPTSRGSSLVIQEQTLLWLLNYIVIYYYISDALCN